MPDPVIPGQRLARLAADELALTVRELVKARKGKDSGVHKARKAIQRLRSLLRLARGVDPTWHRRVDGQLRGLRRRLGGLRDAAVRSERVRLVLETPLPEEHLRAVESAAEALELARQAAWSGLREGFWEQIDRALARQLAGFERWPLVTVQAEHIHVELERARRKLRRASAAALGHVQRNLRHELRRLLRRYAAMRKAAAQALRYRDGGASALVEVARELGVEGDLWLTCTALKATAEAGHTRALRASLEKQRRALCKQHDGELASLRRGLLSRRQARHVERARQARKAARLAAAAAPGDAGEAGIA
jgi:hypothetical protein